ncbi:MAG: amidohydrolase [Anaerolineae bacterium]|jgi:predicted amidohydrolase YtcJ|nr:MAG: amidohydrolase [Anaerolineae bacterium]
MTQLSILYNAHLITQDKKYPKATALAILGEKIIEVGDTQQLLEKYHFSPFKVEGIDLKGKTVLPGLTDAHLHLQHYSLSLHKVNCETDTKEMCLTRVAERTKDLPAGEWILGHGWNQNQWQSGFGDATDLDHVAPHHPVYLTAKSLHAAWANSLALQKAGIHNHTPDPPGGSIVRRSDGSPSGILLESAMQLVEECIPPPSLHQLKQAIRTAQASLLQIGITCIHDFDGKECFTALQELHQDGLLTLRVIKNLPAELMEEAIALGLRSGFGDDRLRLGSLKFFADGALGPRTAAMFEPYLGEPNNCGNLLLDSETLTERGRQAIQNGWSLAVHAIGDRANHEVLNAFQNLRRLERDEFPSTPPKLRHRIEHVQVIHPRDRHRLAELDLIASMQPFHAISDMEMAERYWGQQRNRYAYAWRTQLDHGTVLAFGSDAPVELPNPFWGLHAAVTRQRADGSPSEQGWIPEEKLTLTEALRAYTLGAAYAAGMENRLGKLSPAYYADLIVLDHDPFEVSPEELKDLLPLATMINGQWAWSMQNAGI